MSTMFPADEVNGWLLEQRDKLRAARADLQAQDQTDPEVHDELCRVEGALGAVETTFGYFGKAFG